MVEQGLVRLKSVIQVIKVFNKVSSYYAASGTPYWDVLLLKEAYLPQKSNLKPPLDEDARLIHDNTDIRLYFYVPHACIHTSAYFIPHRRNTAIRFFNTFLQA